MIHTLCKVCAYPVRELILVSSCYLGQDSPPVDKVPVFRPKGFTGGYRSITSIGKKTLVSLPTSLPYLALPFIFLSSGVMSLFVSIILPFSHHFPSPDRIAAFQDRFKERYFTRESISVIPKICPSSMRSFRSTQSSSAQLYS